MAGNGPPPAEHRRRRNADTFGGFERVVDDGVPTGPQLLGEWSEQALAYWDTWRMSPQAKLFLDTDWMRLRMLLPLMESYLTDPTAQKLAEIRQNETLLGATHVDRLRGRIKVERETVTVEASPAVTAIDEYRRQLAG